MPGPLPKDPALRQRRNKAATRAKLKLVDSGRQRMPSLPKRTDGQEWKALTRAWWREVWHSPMSSEYLRVDVHGLFRLAILVDQFWSEPSGVLESVIRLAQQSFGLTPIDRRRLQWEVEKVEAAQKRRSTGSGRGRQPAAADDPRQLLRVVK